MVIKKWTLFLSISVVTFLGLPVFSSAIEEGAGPVREEQLLLEWFSDDEYKGVDGFEGEPQIIWDDLTDVTQVILPTQMIRMAQYQVQSKPYSTYEFLLDFESGRIAEANTSGDDPIQSSCVGERLDKIQKLITESQICDFSGVKPLRPPEQACLTVIYPDYLIIPVKRGELNIGIGSKVDSCALPERDLCDLEKAQELRAEVEALSSDFIDQIESGSTDGRCL